MPNIKSAIKRMRSDAKKAASNSVVLSELKTLDKKLVSLEKKPAEAVKYAKVLISRYDSAVSKGAIPRGRADRKKSRIENFVKRIQKKKK